MPRRHLTEFSDGAQLQSNYEVLQSNKTKVQRKEMKVKH